MRWYFLLLISVPLLTHCASPTAEPLFADDFEAHAVNGLPASPWVQSGAGQVRVDTTRSHSGTQSVYFASGETYTNRAFLGLHDAPLFPLTNNAYYASIYLWVEEASPDGIHWTMVQSSGPVPGESYASEIRYGGQHHKQLMANYETQGVSTDCWHHAQVPLPERQWVKLGWYFDGRANLMKFWLNDKLVDELTVQNRGQGCVANDLEGEWKFPVFENVVIGWVDYQTGGGSRQLWIDDFEMYAEVSQALRQLSSFLRPCP
ncbi:MAG: hypothetical protein AAFQ98_14750 [Bacteroidota bacterium]